MSAARAGVPRLDFTRVVTLARKGLNGQQIAERLGCNRAAIYHMLKREGTTLDALRQAPPACPSS